MAPPQQVLVAVVAAALTGARAQYVVSPPFSATPNNVLRTDLVTGETVAIGPDIVNADGQYSRAYRAYSEASSLSGAVYCMP